MFKLGMRNERIPFFCFEFDCLPGCNALLKKSILIYNNLIRKVT